MAPFTLTMASMSALATESSINFNCVIVGTCLVTIGARTLFGPNISLYSGTHPLDPAVRNGTNGPELGQEIHISEDC